MPEAYPDPIYSLVIPSFEEATLIEDSLNRLRDYLHEMDLFEHTEVIVVAAKGNDNTADLARPFAKKFAHFQLIEPGPKVGKGRDVKAGMLVARGNYILFMDADLATPLKYIEQALELMREQKSDIVIGVRHLWKIHKKLTRKIMSVLANLMVRMFLLPRIPDSQCGFKLFTKDAAETIFKRQTINGWGFDMELLVIAATKHLKVAKIPVKEWADPKLDSGLVGESPMSASINTFKELWRIRIQRAKGVYK